LNRNEGFENTFGIYGLKFLFIQNKNINSIIIQPHVVPTVWDYLFCEACEELFFFQIIKSIRHTQKLKHWDIFQNILFCVPQRKESNTDLEWLRGE